VRNEEMVWEEVVPMRWEGWVRTERDRERKKERKNQPCRRQLEDGCKVKFKARPGIGFKDPKPGKAGP
jgi:hypothetical protein